MTTYKLKVKNLFFAITALSAFFLSSCDNDFDINDEWRDITVIYGLLDTKADTNWVRVQRAYLGKDAASASFDNPDSLYYDQVSVVIKKFENINGTIGNQVGDDIVLVEDRSKKMEEGTFTTDEFRMYRTRTVDRDAISYDSDENYIYKIIVKKTGTDFPDASSTTTVVSEPSTTGFRFIVPNPTVASARIFNGRLEWYAPANAKIYEIDMKVNYKEINRNRTFFLDTSVSIDYGSLEGVAADVSSGTKLDFTQQPSFFYSALAAKLPPLPEGHLRFVKDLEFVVWAGGEDLAKYIDLNKPALGVNANRPEFPDIENGVGLFSSRTDISIDKVALAQAIESSFYLSNTLCDEGFAIVTSGDTCTCRRTSSGPEQVCF